ncbi:MAG: T9SS type A sorting domain-containing protein [Bacteroidota bacterium]|nr:T9SS type A sorting domain-containing protein [Bacteroidota bacterium]
MRQILQICLATTIFSIILFGQASNDECSTATVIGSLPYHTTQNTRLATPNVTDPKISCNDSSSSGKTIWFKFTATKDTGMYFSTIGSTPTADYDIMLGVFVGTCGNFTEAACNDDAHGTRQSEIYMKVKNGTTYYILVGEWGGGGTSGGVPTGGDLVFDAFEGLTPQYVLGPKSGTVASGTSVLIGSFPVIFPKADETQEKFIPKNPELEEKHSEVIKPWLRFKKSKVEPLALEGENYIEDKSSLQTSISRPVILSSHEGIPMTNSIPPDPIMAVGPNHVIVMVNSSFRIFDKNGTALKTIAAQNFLNSIGPGTNPNDPQILYDHYAKRFVMVWMSNPTTTDHRHFIAVSADSNAMGTWYMWSTSALMLGDSITGNWGDYPALSYDSVAVYLTSRQFSLANNGFNYSKLRIFSKTDLYANTASQLQYKDFWNFLDPATLNPVDGLRPYNSYSQTSTAFLLNTPNGSPANYITLWKVSNPGGPSPTIDVNNVPVTQYSSPVNSDQLEGSGALLIESGGKNIRSNPIYRDSSLWAVHCIASGPGNVYSAVRYVKINPFTGKVIEDAALGLTGYWHSWASLMVDKDENVLVTFSRSGLGEYIGAFLSSRKKSDPPGLSSSVPMHEGKGNYIVDFGAKRNRWGDYMGIGLDPVNGNTIWSHTEFAATQNKWSTWVAKTKIGIQPGVIFSLDKSNLNFGSKLLNISSDTTEATIYNDGLDTLTLSASSIPATNFNILNIPITPIKIPGGGTLALKIFFKPTITGALQDSIVFASNDPNNSKRVINLSGVGLFVTMSQPGIMYGVSGTLDGKKLYAINSSDGVATLIGPLDQPQITAMRVHPSTKELIGYDQTGAQSGGAFYRVSSTVGNTVQFSTTNILGFKGLAFENDSIVFMGLPNGALDRVNINTGQAFQFGLNTDLRVGSLARNPINGTLWMTNRAFFGTNDSLFKVNTITGVATSVGNTNNAIADILFDKNGKLYGLTGTGSAINKLVLIDTSNAAIVEKGSLGKSNILAIALNPDAVADVRPQAKEIIPATFSLEQNYPNPFNPVTTIRYGIPQGSHVTLKVYDALGKEISTLADGWRSPGVHQEYFDASQLASGVYFYKLSAGTFAEIKKMMVIK